FVVERGEPSRPEVLSREDASEYTAGYGRFWMHADVPGHRWWVDYGDSLTRRSPEHAVNQALAYYAGLYQRQGKPVEAGLAEWLRQRRLEQNGDFESWTALHFLWYRDGITPVSPQGKVPLYGHFRDYELHIFRDSWEDPQASWFAFKC